MKKRKKYTFSKDKSSMLLLSAKLLQNNFGESKSSKIWHTIISTNSTNNKFKEFYEKDQFFHKILTV